jgi:2-dehydro-3-deoxyphosphogluconate aldolase/(4S)-4-hydroxy-2-oxoglutarate aldolase
MDKTLDKQRTNTLSKIIESQLVAIIRLASQSEIQPVIKCLVEGGVTTLEITANTPGYCEEISKTRANYPNILVGAGTVINTERANKAIEAGAQFLVTPNTDESVVQLAHSKGIPVLMGALTPTDIAQAISYNADLIKVFPAGSLGLDYFNSLKGPFSDTPLMPVGGVNLDNIQDWFSAGAISVGVGNDLTSAVTTPAQQNDLITLVRAYLAKLPKNKGIKHV